MILTPDLNSNNWRLKSKAAGLPRRDGWRGGGLDGYLLGYEPYDARWRCGGMTTWWLRLAGERWFREPHEAP